MFPIQLKVVRMRLCFHEAAHRSSHDRFILPQDSELDKKSGFITVRMPQDRAAYSTLRGRFLDALFFAMVAGSVFGLVARYWDYVR
jgi:hypothetical protein